MTKDDDEVVYVGGQRYVLAEEKPAADAPEPEVLHRLTAPPRRVSAGVMVRLVMSGTVFFGWFFACAGMFMACMMLKPDSEIAEYLFVSVFLGIGLGTVLYPLYRGVRTAWFLRNGSVALGRVRDVEATGMKVNNQRVMKVTYRFTAEDGEKYTASYRATNVGPITDGPYEVLFYDPRMPTRIFPLDVLAGVVTVDEGDGSFRLAGGARILTCVMAVIYLAFLAVFAFQWGIFLRGFG